MQSRIQDPRKFGRVAVAMGGSAAEREISLRSGAAVLAALKRNKIDAAGVDIGDRPQEKLSIERFDRVFNIVHGRGGEDGVLQGVLDAMGLPYTGSGILGSALAMDKLQTKLCWKGAGLPTPTWMLLKHEADIQRCEQELGFPVIIKPTREGSSIGMSKVCTRDELFEAWKNAARHNCGVFAESWVQGTEYTAGFVGDRQLPLIRLETPNSFYDFDAKYRSDTTQYHCPCGLDAKLERELQELAATACAAVAVSAWGRVDLFLDESLNPWLIEVNTVPGMTDHSLIPMAANSIGIDFDDLVWRILETSLPIGV